MLKVAIVDANESAKVSAIDRVGSVVGGWLEWEIERAGVGICATPAEADVVFLVFSGALGYVSACSSALRRAGIVPRSGARGGHPYVVTGGPCDAIPLSALEVADVVAIGEGVRLVRSVLDVVVSNGRVCDVDAVIGSSDHAIRRRDVAALRRDARKPWLLADTPSVLATPDGWVDWTIPPIRSSDGVTRLVVEKGCRNKCLFCATSYRQQHSVSPRGIRVAGDLRDLRSRGERVQVVANDAGALPFYHLLGRLDSESYTYTALSKPGAVDLVVRARTRIVRIGVEGISERIRRAFAKPIATDGLMELLRELGGRGLTTHVFLIVGAPYESPEDWVEFRDMWVDLTRCVRYGLCRVKMTAFVPTPPAPLYRYIGPPGYEDRFTEFVSWMRANAASRHVMFVRPRGVAQNRRDVAEQLGVSVGVVPNGGDTVDLAPTVDEYRRMPSEVVGWPIDAHVRWRAAEVYQRRMCGGTRWHARAS